MVKLQKGVKRNVSAFTHNSYTKTILTKILFVVHMDINDFRLPDKLASDPKAFLHKIKNHDLKLKLIFLFHHALNSQYSSNDYK